MSANKGVRKHKEAKRSHLARFPDIHGVTCLYHYHSDYTGDCGAMLTNNMIENEYYATLLIHNWNLTGKWDHERDTSVKPEADTTFGVISALYCISDPAKSESEFPTVTAMPCITIETPMFVITTSYGRRTLREH